MRNDKVRNYLIWARHLGLSADAIFAHFVPIMGEQDMSNLVDEVLRREVVNV